MSKTKYLTAILTLAAVTGIAFSFGFQSNAVSMNLKSEEGVTQLGFRVEKGYGIQKDGPHQIVVYEIDPSDINEENVLASLREKGRELQKFEDVKFSGNTARENEKYFSEVNPYALSVKKRGNGVLAVSAKIYYCSFENNFCSVESIQKILE